MNLNQVDVSKLPADVRKQFKQLQVMHAERKIQNKAKNDFLSFVKCVWPEFIEGAHHRHIAKKFNDLANGKIKRLIINMPPRHTKSEFASYLLPSWMVGRNPKLKIIQVTHTGELAIRFGRKAKHLIDSEDYAKIFKTTLQEDFITAKKAIGFSKIKIIYIHALKNAAPPIITILALSLSGSLGGAIITEAVFDWPGMGRLYFEAISVMDLPIIIGATYVLTVLFLISILVADLLYGYFDPRVKTE